MPVFKTLYKIQYIGTDKTHYIIVMSQTYWDVKYIKMACM